MKIPDKKELQQIAFNNSADIDSKYFLNLYKRCTSKTYSFLVNDTTLASDNPLPYRCNLLERIYKLIMTIEDKIRDEKLQYDINREAAKISGLSSRKIDKYEYLTVGEYYLLVKVGWYNKVYLFSSRKSFPKAQKINGRTGNKTNRGFKKSKSC